MKQIDKIPIKYDIAECIDVRKDDLVNSIDDLLDIFADEIIDYIEHESSLIDINDLIFELKKDGMLTEELENWILIYLKNKC